MNRVAKRNPRAGRKVRPEAKEVLRTLRHAPHRLDVNQERPRLLRGQVADQQGERKRSAVLDLKTPAGHAAMLRLVSQADVVVESFRPGVMDKLGLGYAALAAANPKIVLCSISGF